MTHEEKLKSELAALRSASRVLDKMDPELRARVLTWLVEKYAPAPAAHAKDKAP